MTEMEDVELKAARSKRKMLEMEKDIEEAKKALSYVPRLIGVRPLANGRLVLAYINDESNEEEIFVYDLWDDFKDRKEEDPISKWYNQDFFNKVYMYGDTISWGSGLDMWSGYLYKKGKPTEEDFECVK